MCRVRHGERQFSFIESVCGWLRGVLRRFTGGVLRIVSDGGRKRVGSESGISRAHPYAVLSETKILIRPYRVPAREGIQSPGVTAHAFAYVTDRRNLDESSLPPSSRILAIRGFGGADGR